MKFKYFSFQIKFYFQEENKIFVYIIAKFLT